MALIKDPNDMYQPVTLEAYDLVFGDRNTAYGHPFDDFSTTAAYLTTYLDSRGLLKTGAAVIAEDVAPVMSLVKLSRYANGINTGDPRRDTTVDKAGYAEAEWRVIEERKRRGEVERGLAVLSRTRAAVDFTQAVQDKAGALWLTRLAGAEFREPTDEELGGLFREARGQATAERRPADAADYPDAPPADQPPSPADPQARVRVTRDRLEINGTVGPTCLFQTAPCVAWARPELTWQQQRVFGTLEVLCEAANVWGNECVARGLAWTDLTIEDLRRVVLEARARLRAAKAAA